MKKRALKNEIEFHTRDNFPVTGIITKQILQLKQINKLINNYLQIVAGRLNTLLK